MNKRIKTGSYQENNLFNETKLGHHNKLDLLNRKCKHHLTSKIIKEKLPCEFYMMSQLDEKIFSKTYHYTCISQGSFGV